MSTTTTIDIPFPEAEALHLRLTIGACRLRIKPGDGPQWVAGTYQDPSKAVPMRIDQQGGTVRITQQFSWPQAWGPIGQPPTFDLAIGKGRPFALSLEGGASESIVDLGGLPLTNLTIRHGAGRQEFDFSAPNPQPMAELSLSAGAAGLELKHLANANFAQMIVEGGAAGYELDFGGTLQRDGKVKITAGMAAVAVRVPTTTAARISADTILGSIELDDGFTKKEGAFWNEAAVAGEAPVLTISASVVMGSIRLVAV